MLFIGIEDICQSLNVLLRGRQVGVAGYSQHVFGAVWGCYVIWFSTEVAQTKIRKVMS
jgi:hypothetical protein